MKVTETRAKVTRAVLYRLFLEEHVFWLESFRSAEDVANAILQVFMQTLRMLEIGSDGYQKFDKLELYLIQKWNQIIKS